MDTDRKRNKLKRTAAAAALIAFAAVLVIMIYAMFTHDQGLLMLSLVCLIIVPAIIYVFIIAAKLGKH